MLNKLYTVSIKKERENWYKKCIFERDWRAKNIFEVDYAKEKYVFVTDSTSNIIVSDYFISAYTAYASLFNFSIVLITDSSSNIDP